MLEGLWREFRNRESPSNLWGGNWIPFLIEFLSSNAIFAKSFAARAEWLKLNLDGVQNFKEENINSF